MPSANVTYVCVLVMLATLLSAVLLWDGSLFEGSLILVATLAAGCAVVFELWRTPQLCLGLVVVSGMLMPFEVGSGTQSTLNPAYIFAALATVIWILKTAESGAKLPQLRFTMILAAFAGSCILSWAFGFLPWYTLEAAPLVSQVAGLSIFLLSVSVFFAAAEYLRQSIWLNRIVWCFMGLGALHAVSLAVPELPRVLHPNDGAAGSLFWTWLGALSFGQALSNRKLSVPARLLCLVPTALGLYATFGLAREWASGWLPTMVALGVSLLWERPRTAVVLGIASAAVIAIQFQSVWQDIFTGEQEYSLTTRLAAWGVLWEVFKTNPLTGLGPANYYFYTALYPLLGWYVRFASHNNYVDLALQGGAFGLLTFIGFALGFVRRIWLSRAVEIEGFDRGFITGAIGGLIGTLAAGMLGDWFLPLVYNVGLKGFPASVLAWIFLGALAGKLDRDRTVRGV